VGSTLVSMTMAYLGHRYWSFSHRSRTGVRREYTLFAIINTVTLLLGVAVVAGVRYGLDQDGALIMQAANIGSIVLGTAIRYLTYRQWVFPAADAQPAVPEDAPQAPPAAARPSPSAPHSGRPRRAVLADETG
jgi:putative flippase GtrA